MDDTLVVRFVKVTGTDKEEKSLLYPTKYNDKTR